MSHILVISQYFYPEQFRINDICAEWVKRGNKVTVITGIPNYPQGKYYKGYGICKRRKESYKGINIIRIPVIPRGHNALMLVLNYLSFVVTGFLWKLFTKINADYVFIYEVSPMTQALPGVWYARKKKIPCYLYVTDLWPENVEIVAGIKSKGILKAIGSMVDYIYKRCNRIFTSSKSFIASINKRGVDIGKLEFWPQYAEEFYKPVKRGTVQVPEIKEDGFNIVGDGRFKDTLIDLVYKHNLSEMFNFISRQPAIRIPEFMSVCDAALICLSRSKVFSMTLPAKMQSCLACGIPIIVSADGEVQDVIREAKAGTYSNAGNAEMLALKIKNFVSKSDDELKRMANNAYQYSKQNYDKESLLSRMDGFLI